MSRPTQSQIEQTKEAKEQKIIELAAALLPSFVARAARHYDYAETAADALICARTFYEQADV